MAWGVVLILFMPDGPHNGKMFSEYERIVAVWRIRRNMTGVQHAKFLPHQVKEAFLDPKTYLLLLVGACVGILNGGVSNFASVLIKGFGFTGLQANLLQAPSGAIQIVMGVAFGCLAILPNMVGVSFLLSCLPGMSGLIGILLISLEHRWALLGCAWMQSIVGSCIVLNWTQPSMNVAGHTKRSTIMGLYFMFYCAGNIAGPHLFLPEEAPRYKTAIKGLLASYGAAMVLQTVYMCLCYMHNKSRDRRDLHAHDAQEAFEGFEDFTDKENKHFRYRL